jgi:hypothetical protein
LATVLLAASIPHFVQHLHNIQIAIGLSRVFRFDDFPDLSLYAFRSDGLSRGRVDGAVEEELQLKDPLRDRAIGSRSPQEPSCP